MKAVVTKVIRLFALVQLAALFIGSLFISQGVSAVENPASTDNSFYLFGTIVVFAVVLLVILKYYKGKLLFVFLELAMQFTAIELLLAAFLNGTAPLLVALASVAIRLKWPQTRQIFLLITIAVVGGLLGSSLDILPAAILAVLLAGYDVVAVFYTKHMVSLAKGLTQRGAAFSIKIQEKKEKLELGTGDVVIPAMLIVSANKIGKNLVTVSGFNFTLPSIFALVGAVAGITILLFFLEKHRGYWPALPPITAGTLIGIGITTLI